MDVRDGGKWDMVVGGRWLKVGDGRIFVDSERLWTSEMVGNGIWW